MAWTFGLTGGFPAGNAPAMLTPVPLFRNTLFAVGLVLLACGACNAIVAQTKLNEYHTALNQVWAETEQTSASTSRLQHVASEAWSRRVIAQAKLDFYSVLHTVGWLMLGTGLVCTLVAVHRHRYQRPRAASLSSR